MDLELSYNSHRGLALCLFFSSWAWNGIALYLFIMGLERIWNLELGFGFIALLSYVGLCLFTSHLSFSSRPPACTCTHYLGISQDTYPEHFLCLGITYLCHHHALPLSIHSPGLRSFISRFPLACVPHIARPSICRRIVIEYCCHIPSLIPVLVLVLVLVLLFYTWTFCFIFGRLHGRLHIVHTYTYTGRFFFFVAHTWNWNWNWNLYTIGDLTLGCN